MKWIRQLPVKRVESVLDSGNKARLSLDLRIGNILTIAFNQLKTDMIMEWVAIMEMLEGVFRRPPAAEGRGGTFLRVHLHAAGPGKSTCHASAGFVPHKDTPGRHIMPIRFRVNGECLFLHKDTVVLVIEDKLRASDSEKNPPVKTVPPVAGPRC